MLEDGNSLSEETMAVVATGIVEGTEDTIASSDSATIEFLSFDCMASLAESYPLLSIHPLSLLP